MTREQVIDTLRAHEPELKAEGVLRVEVFGSVARGAQSDESDIDLLVDFDDSKNVSLLDLVRIENRLCDLLGAKVDLVQRKSLRTRVRQNAEREAVLAF